MNALLQRLVLVQLTPVTNEFRSNLHTNRRFSIDSMYKALILPELPVDINKMILKMNIPLKTKIFGWYLHRGVILTKDNIVKQNWQGSKNVFPVMKMRLSKTFFPMPIC
jgi:hypothetical protein